MAEGFFASFWPARVVKFRVVNSDSCGGFPLPAFAVQLARMDAAPGKVLAGMVTSWRSCLQQARRVYT